MNLKIKKIKKLLLQIVFIALLAVVQSCSEVLPELPEKAAGPPSITIKTMLPGNDQPQISNGLIEIETDILFFAEATDVRNENISYSWFINNDLISGETTEFLNYSFDEPGNFTLKSIVSTGSETTEASLDIAVFEINTIQGRSIENGTYICKFNSDDDAEDETYTCVFSGTNNIDLRIEGTDFGPADSYTLSGEWDIQFGEGDGGNYLYINFLIKEDNEFGDLWHYLNYNFEWVIFDIGDKTYLNAYPMQEAECWDNTPFAINRQYEGSGSYSGLDYTDSWNTSTKMIKDGIICNYSFFAGIDQDSLPVIKYYEEEIFEWDYSELVDGALNHIQLNGINYLYYSGEKNVMHLAMLFEKQ